MVEHELKVDTAEVAEFGAVETAGLEVEGEEAMRCAVAGEVGDGVEEGEGVAVGVEWTEGGWGEFGEEGFVEDEIFDCGVCVGRVVTL